MKKIPTLFERVYENHKVVGITEKVTPGMEWVLNGEGVATVKIDGSCTMVKDGQLYKRYDAKKVKRPPVGAISCCEPDPVTGHWPHWVKVSADNPADKWYLNAFINTPETPNGTYEAIGVHFQGNPYGLSSDILEPHGKKKIEVGRTFNEIRKYLSEHNIEGIVFWKDGEPKCKIKRTDFGFEWPVKNVKENENAESK